MKNRRYEKGVALLFALGVLSLMLVCGLAFLGNSLISQKISLNSSEASFARQLARSAASRAMAQLAMFNLFQSAYHEDAGFHDAFQIYSSLRYNEAVNLTAAGSRNDGLSTKLLLPELAENASFAAYGPQSRAKWLYVYDNGVISDDGATAPAGNPKIIGRFAYQVLPQTSRSRISLFAVTDGAKHIAGSEGTAATAQDRKRPRVHRWGSDVDELLIPDLLDRTNGPDTGLFAKYWGNTTAPDSNEAPQYELDNFFNLFSSPNSPNHLSGNDDLTKNYRNWLRNMFAEGKERIAREAYSDNSTPVRWYPRFNLGRFDNGENWNERFIKGGETVDTVKNNSVIVDRLTRHPGNTQTIDGATSAGFYYKDGYEDDSRYDPFGLPFLRRIGNSAEKGSFTDVEHLRKQITANLNDYCDEDSIPTSDVPASTWGDLTGSGLPSYTGNEKTPYINEIALGVRFQNAKFTQGKFEGDVDAEILAELIKIYKEVPSIDKFSLKGRLNDLTLNFKVTFSGSATVTFVNAHGVNESKTVSIPETTPLSDEKEIKITQFQNRTFEMKRDDTVAGSGPYWVKNFRSDSVDTSKNTLSIDFAEKIQALDSSLSGISPSNISVTPSKISLNLVSVSLDMPNLALMINDSAVTPADYGVDFVKLNANSVITVDTELFNIETSSTTLAAATAGDKCIVHTGFMQAIDPRQNLNANFGTAGAPNVKESDWRFDKEHSLNLKPSSTPWQWNDLASRVDSGKVFEKCSNPNAPKYANETTIDDLDKDSESTTDPAWQADAQGSHISTAVIRNKPMRSLWELGFIHRGIPFQTINLKDAGGIENHTSEQTELADTAHHADNFVAWNNDLGTRYRHGDAGILDQIKMTSYNKSYGKVDIEALAVSAPWWNAATTPSVATMNLAIFKSLFNNIRRQQPEEFLAESVSDNQVLHVGGVPTLTGTVYPLTGVTALPSAVVSSLRSKVLLADAAKWVLSTDTTDAAKEELIGKTFNLIEGRSSSPPNVFRILVVAQSIRDLEGTLARWDFNVTPNVLRQISSPASFGVFDYDSTNNVYYDEIMGECRMLVTVEKTNYPDTDGTPRARLRVKQIEYLD